MFDMKVTHVPAMIAPESTREFPYVLHCGEDKHTLHKTPMEQIKCHNSSVGECETENVSAKEDLGSGKNLLPCTFIIFLP